MGPNEQNQHFAELRQNVCLYIHVLVRQRGLLSLGGKLEQFVTKKCKKRLPNSSQTDYRQHLPFGHMFLTADMSPALSATLKIITHCSLPVNDLKQKEDH